MGTEPVLQAGRQRKRIEIGFGGPTATLGRTRLRPRGLSGARDE